MIECVKVYPDGRLDVIFGGGYLIEERLARLRRKLSLELVAERAGISRATLISIEKGTPTVSIGSYAAVLHALNNMDSDLLLIAKDDEFGRKLQDLALPTRRRAPKKGE